MPHLPRLLRALWAVRLAALAIAGPALGVAILATTFGLTAAMLRLAGAMTALASIILAPLVRAEYRRMAARQRGR